VIAGPRLESPSGREQLLAKTKRQYLGRTKVWLYVIEPCHLDRPFGAGPGVAGPGGPMGLLTFYLNRRDCWRLSEMWPMIGERVSLTAVVVAVDWLTATHGVLSHVSFKRYTGPTGSWIAPGGIPSSFVLLCAARPYISALLTLFWTAPSKDISCRSKFDGRLGNTQRGLPKASDL
jgi:hypothetical protein